MKRLFRSKTRHLPGGVCGGLGEHPGVDPAGVRLIRVVLTLLSVEVGLPDYLRAWNGIPEESAQADPKSPDQGDDGKQESFQGR